MWFLVKNDSDNVWEICLFRCERWPFGGGGLFNFFFFFVLLFFLHSFFFVLISISFLPFKEIDFGWEWKEPILADHISSSQPPALPKSSFEDYFFFLPLFSFFVYFIHYFSIPNSRHIFLPFFKFCLFFSFFFFLFTTNGSPGYDPTCYIHVYFDIYWTTISFPEYLLISIYFFHKYLQRCFPIIFPSHSEILVGTNWQYFVDRIWIFHSIFLQMKRQSVPRG